ncbi:GNAT family N-acetyltransferase [Kitasatospora sp. NPDC056138]|uniref:GNAT family N-acetyltransferase n=1 Tax=Kitasatospora sp. NPDC056138 TaxID=3345724 RepID=UPI0035DD63DB
MIFRSTVESDLGRSLPLLVADPACATMTADDYTRKLAGREYRPEWTWIAEEGPDGPPLALAVWWGAPEHSEPGALDGFFVHESVGSAVDRIGLAADLLTAAHAGYAGAGVAEAPEYHVFLPGDWRDRPAVAAALTWRREAARLAGLSTALERLRYEWTPQDGLPEPSGRLRFRAEPDDEVFVGILRRVLEGTLDSGSRKGAEQIGAERQARADVAFYRDRMSGERSWWRLAETPDGEVVGFGLPSHNPAFPVVGYLGVLPEQRGRGYVDEILAEITRILAVEAGAERIRADTDLANVPMAAAFERGGYRNFARRLVLSAG